MWARAKRAVHDRPIRARGVSDHPRSTLVRPERSFLSPRLRSEMIRQSHCRLARACVSAELSRDSSQHPSCVIFPDHDRRAVRALGRPCITRNRSNGGISCNTRQSIQHM